MEFLPKNPILEFGENDLEEIRKKYDLDKLERIKEAVDILEEWVQKQPHFVKKDFPRRYLEATIVSCKGSLERAKSRIDKMCTFKTVLPQFFGDFDCSTDFKELFDCVVFAVIPKKDQDQNRILCGKVIADFYPRIMLDVFRLAVILGEYLKVHDYADGFQFVLDYCDVDMMNVVKNINIVDLRNGMSIVMDGLCCNVRGIHLLTTSKYIEMLVNILKQVVSAKVGNRIFAHQNTESLYERVPRELLPIEYGGKQRPLKELDKEWKKIYGSEEHREFMRKMSAIASDESLRPTDNNFNDQYMGMPGTFRALSVD